MTNSQRLLGSLKRKECVLCIAEGDVGMREAVGLSTMTGLHKPLASGPNPLAATIFCLLSLCKLVFG